MLNELRVKLKELEPYVDKVLLKDVDEEDDVMELIRIDGNLVWHKAWLAHDALGHVNVWMGVRVEVGYLDDRACVMKMVG